MELNWLFPQCQTQTDNLVPYNTHSDTGTEFRSDTFRKWYSKNKIHFNSAAIKHQEQNGLVEWHCVFNENQANNLLWHARLDRKFFHHAAKYAQYIHNNIPVCDLLDENSLPTTPSYLVIRRKSAVKHFGVFRCPAVFKQYKVPSDGKHIHNKYNQQEMTGIFVRIPDDASSWLFYIRSTKQSYIFLKSYLMNLLLRLLCYHLPYKGTIKLHDTGRHISNQDIPNDFTGVPTGQEVTFPPEEYDLPRPSRKHIISDISDLASYPKRGSQEALEEASTNKCRKCLHW